MEKGTLMSNELPAASYQLSVCEVLLYDREHPLSTHTLAITYLEWS